MENPYALPPSPLARNWCIAGSIHPVEQPAQRNISCVSIPLAAVIDEEDDHLQVIINEMENDTHLLTEDFDDYFAKL